MASIRASKIIDMSRIEHMASTRASETSTDFTEDKSRIESAWLARECSMTLEAAVSSFQSEVKHGPNFVCTC